MDHFDFGTNSIAAVVIDIGRTKLSDGSWLYEKIKKNLISRAKNEVKNCLIFMSQSSEYLPKTISESTYQIDIFKQNFNDYPIIDQIRKAAETIGESSEDAQKHLVLITKNFNDSYADAFQWIKNKDYELKIKIIGIGKDTDLLELTADEFGFDFVKVNKIEAITEAIEGIGN